MKKNKKKIDYDTWFYVVLIIAIIYNFGYLGIAFINRINTRGCS